LLVAIVCTGVSITWIRVPNQTKRQPGVIQFQTTQEKHVDGIVATLAALYRGQPVSSVRIGRSYGMSHHQVLIYLHMAKHAGQATPVFSRAGGVIQGWVPGHVEVKHTRVEERAIKAADAVKQLFSGEPVSAKRVSQLLNRPTGTVVRWLKAAEQMKLVRKPASGWGWMPA